MDKYVYEDKYGKTFYMDHPKMNAFSFKIIFKTKRARAVKYMRFPLFSPKYLQSMYAYCHKNVS